MSQVQQFQRQRWLCLIAVLLICVCAGFGYAWSVLQTPITAVHRWPAGQVSLAYPVTVLCSSMAPLFFGGLIRRIGTRLCVVVGAVLFGGGLFLTGTMTQLWQLFLFYGVCAGLGCGFIYPSMMAYAVRIFPDRAGLASGLGTAAFGSGAILWAPIAVALTEGFSLAFAFRALGILFLAVILAGSLLLREPPEGLSAALCPAAGPAEAEEGGLRRGEMVRTGAFYLTVAAFTCGLIAGVIVISQASPILQQSLAYTPERAAVFVSVFAACNMAGRFLWGGLSDRIGLGATMAAVFVLCAASMLLLALAGGQAALVLAGMGLAASCYGGFASVLTPLTARLFGGRYLTENYGVMYIVFGIASLIGPILAVRSSGFGSYTPAFLISAALSLAGLVLSRRSLKTVKR